jgi:hypothetical protein
MSALLFLALTTVSSQVTDDFGHDWQRCLVDTSKLWAAKPLDPQTIVDAATIYCRDKLELFMISETKEVKQIGLNEGQAAEYMAFLAGGLLRINRSFALEAIQQARAK